MQIYKAASAGKSHPDTHAFDDYAFFGGKLGVRVVKVRFWYKDLVHGIEFFYETPEGVVSSGKHMGPQDTHLWDLNYEEFYLDRDEFITKVHGHAGNVIDHIILETSKGRSHRVGPSNGGAAFHIDIPAGTGVVGFFGGYGGHLHNIGVYYRPLSAPLQYHYGYVPEHRLGAHIQVGMTHPDTHVADDVKKHLSDSHGQFRIYKIVCYHDDFIYGLKIVYERNGEFITTTGYGKEFKAGLKHDTFYFQTGEFITKVWGRNGNLIDKICFETNKGRKVEWGKNGGKEFDMHIPAGHAVAGFAIGFGGHVHNITAYHGPAPHVGIFKSSAPYTAQYSTLAHQSEVFGKTHKDTVQKDDFDIVNKQTANHRIIKVRVWHGSLIYGVQFKYEINGQVVDGHRQVGNEFSKDAKAGKAKKGGFKLNRGEYIVKVEGRNGNVLDSLTFTLNTGKVHTFGGKGGSPFHAPIPEKNAVGAISIGRNGHIHNIRVWYGPINYIAQSQSTFFYDSAQSRYSHAAARAGHTHPDTKDFHDEVDLTQSSHRIAAVTCWHADMIYGWQVVYESNGQYISGKQHLGSEFNKAAHPKVDTLYLDVDEHIVKVSGRNGNVVDQIHIVTSKGKQVTWGGHGGEPFELNVPAGHGVGSFVGGHNGHIHNIGVVTGTIPRCYTSHAYVKL